MRSVEERNADMYTILQALKESVEFDIRTAMPGIVQAWDPVQQTVDVQLAIRENLEDDDDETEVEIPLLVDVPVVMPRAGGYSLAFAPAAGDECLVVFADCCIDAWWQSGGVQSQVDRRRHDLSDGFAILGCWSQMNKPSIPSEGVRLQNDAGTAGVSVIGNNVNLFGTATINGGAVRGKISDLPGSNTFTGTDLLEIEIDGTSYKLTGATLAAMLKTIGGLLTGSDLKANLTTTTVGSPLDATQGKALSDMILDRVSGENFGNYSTLESAAEAVFSAMSIPSIKVGRFTRNNVGAYIFVAYKNSANYAMLLCWSYGASKLTQINMTGGTVQTPLEYIPAT